MEKLQNVVFETIHELVVRKPDLLYTYIYNGFRLIDPPNAGLSLTDRHISSHRTRRYLAPCVHPCARLFERLRQCRRRFFDLQCTSIHIHRGFGATEKCGCRSDLFITGLFIIIKNNTYEIKPIKTKKTKNKQNGL